MTGLQVQVALGLLEMMEHIFGRRTGKVGGGGAVFVAFDCHQVEGGAEGLSADGGMRLTDEVLQAAAEPVIPSREARRVVHALLDHTPVALSVEDEGVMVQLIAVLHSSVVHLSGEP